LSWYLPYSGRKKKKVVEWEQDSVRFRVLNTVHTNSPTPTALYAATLVGNHSIIFKIDMANSNKKTTT
jgi:hypothetical protein